MHPYLTHDVKHLVKPKWIVDTAANEQVTAKAYSANILKQCIENIQKRSKAARIHFQQQNIIDEIITARSYLY